ncbi:MAG: FkbM family methyltransferase [Planctomycetota bacterium]|nr:FkbM family methyltransferase [Planctomycetota bacterium]
MSNAMPSVRDQSSMALTPAELRLLDQRAKLATGSAIQKVLSRPAPTLVSKVMERWCRARGRAYPTLATTFWGAPMHVVVPDRVSLTIMRYGFFEDDLTKVFALVLRPGMVFFDVGSHFGYFSLLASHLVGPSGQVHAFEPTPSTYEVVSKNLAPLAHARANNVAVWREDSEMTFRDFGVEFSAFNSLGASKLTQAELARARVREVKVRARSLDSYVAETGVAPDFLKIDTEGAELDVLRGMERLLAEKRPALTLEVGDVGTQAGDRESRRVVDHMLARGYDAFELAGDRLVPHTPRERYDYGNILFGPRA